MVHIGEQPPREAVAFGRTHANIARIGAIGHTHVINAEVSARLKHAGGEARTEHARRAVCSRDICRKSSLTRAVQHTVKHYFAFPGEATRRVVKCKIGRASWRERVGQYV